MRNKRDIVGTLFVIIAGICWGVIGIFTRALSLYGVDSIQITFIRNLVAAIGMALIILIKSPKVFQIKLKDSWMFLGTGLCSIVLFNICYFKAIEITTMSLAAVLLYTAPCFVMIMSVFFFKERMTFQKGLALAMAFAGCLLSTGIIGEKLLISPWGILIGVGAGFGYALYSIFGTIALRKYGTSTVTFYTFLIAACTLFPFVGIKALDNMCSAGWSAWMWASFLGVISTLIPFLAYTKGLRYLEAGKASIMAFVEPLVATLCGFVLYQEKMNMYNIFGIALIFGSVVFLNIQFKGKRGIK